MKRHLIAAAGLLALGIGAVFAQDDVIASRKQTMKEAGQAQDDSIKMLKGQEPFDLAKVQAMQTAVVNQQQQEKIDQMKRDFQRKGEDAQAAYQKRLQEIIGPVYEDIGKALDAYAKALDVSGRVSPPLAPAFIRSAAFRPAPRVRPCAPVGLGH